MDTDTDCLLYTATLLRGLAGPERNGELANSLANGELALWRTGTLRQIKCQMTCEIN